MKILIILALMVSFLYPSIILKKNQLSHLKIKRGIANCWQRGSQKYVVVVDTSENTYAINGSAKSKAQMTPRLGWKNKNLLLKSNGNPVVFSHIIADTLESGCTRYYGY